MHPDIILGTKIISGGRWSSPFSISHPSWRLRRLTQRRPAAIIEILNTPLGHDNNSTTVYHVYVNEPVLLLYDVMMITMMTTMMTIIT